MVRMEKTFLNLMLRTELQEPIEYFGIMDLEKEK
jgi:hypothetical protein